MKTIDILLILISVIFSSAAQLLLKFAMNTIGEINLTENVFSVFCKMLSNIYLYCGLFVFAISLIIWLFVLSRVPVSVAYPFVGVGCIITMVFAPLFLNESISFQKTFGVLAVFLGIVLISR